MASMFGLLLTKPALIAIGVLFIWMTGGAEIIFKNPMLIIFVIVAAVVWMRR